MANNKNSKQRDAILRGLQSRCDHPTAEQLYFDLKSECPALSLATVYRNLNVLEEQGLVRRIPAVEADRFDGDISLHYHLTCQKCGCLIDLKVRGDEIIDKLPVDFDGEIKSHSLMFYGLCPKCKNGEKTA